MRRSRAANYDRPMTTIKTRDPREDGRSCGQTPSGKPLSWSDPIAVQVTRRDLGALFKAIDAAITHLDEARGTESRITFAERLIRLKKAAQDAVWDHDEVPPEERSYDV